MDFLDELKALAQRIPSQLPYLETEEATKNALVMPFINILGYDVFNPTEVVPEFTADVGTKRGEKVDYAIMKDGKPTLLFECKTAKANLAQEHASQLFRYFTVTEARIGVLTNGVVYQFYSDLDALNKMDTKPFMEIDLLNSSDASMNELKMLTKSSFNLDDTLEAAAELKYTGEMKRIFATQLHEPTGDFVRLLASKVYTGRISQSVVDQFSQLTKKAFNDFIKERINDTLKTALARDVTGPSDIASPDIKDVDELIEEEASIELDIESGIVTTMEEQEGYMIVKAILREEVDVSRIAIRDTKSYCGILLDDNNRKPICRLRFNSSRKYLGLFNDDRAEERFQLASLDAIYQYADELKAAVVRYEDETGL